MKRVIIFSVIISLLPIIFGNIGAYAWTTSRDKPEKITDKEYTYPAFDNGKQMDYKKNKRHLPAMGWNSWNAFGSGNTEALTKAMADAIETLGLKELGYEYIVLDDGCYRTNRVDGKISNNTARFPSGFKALSDYVHDKGLKFGMYNDIGTNLCAGDAVGTCGFEESDAKTYLDWGVDFLKVDNCYYLWDNATFSNSANAKYTYAPNIRSIKITGADYSKMLSAVNDGELLGKGARKNTSGNYVTNLGTFDGTNTGQTPVGELSGELAFNISDVPADGEYTVTVNYATAQKPEVGEWLQLAVGEKENETRYYDDFLAATSSETSFTDSQPITVNLTKGSNVIRLMNHRRQENTLQSYAALADSLNAADPDKDVYLSICEWGKTQPQHWGYKVGGSWRILNDISFAVGNTSGSHGSASWGNGGTASIASQYNKAVIMDEFAGLDRGWNDPDMLVIGMDGITETMSKTHMTMWCMMNSPLMLGLDLRRVTKGDAIWNIIANGDVIALNQDALGVQAKRIYCSKAAAEPDKAYIEDNNRVDVLAKPLADGGVALSFINLSGAAQETPVINKELIMNYIGKKAVNADKFSAADKYYVKDLWTKEASINNSGEFSVGELDAYDNVTIKIMPFSDASDVKVILKEQIDLAKKQLESNDTGNKKLLTDAKTALETAVAGAEELYGSGSADTAALEAEIDALFAAREAFTGVYEAYGKFGETVSSAEAIEKRQDKYVKDEAWAAFIAALEKARGIYENPQTEEEMETAAAELEAAKKAVHRDMHDDLEPVAWYIFDAEDNGVIEDVSGSGNDARITGAGAKLTGENSLSLNANNENDGYMTLPSVLKDADNFTFAAWIKISEYREWARLFDFGVSSSEGYMFLCPNNNVSDFKYAITRAGAGGEQGVACAQPAAGAWAHVAVTQDNNTVKIYINGAQKSSGTITIKPSDILTESANCYIGKSQYADPYLKGEIRDVRIYDKSLTEAQIGQIIADYDSGIASAGNVNVKTRLGRKPPLPASVNVTMDSGAQTTASVTWEDVNEEDILKGQPFTVYGAIAGTAVKARADVTFESMSVNDDFHAEIAQAEKDGARTAELIAANLSGTDKDVHMYLASYGEDGAINGAKHGAVTVKAGSYGRLSLPVYENGVTRVFVWDGDMAPVTNPQEINPYGTVSWTVVRPAPDEVTVNSCDSITIRTNSGDLWNKQDGQGTAKNVYLTKISDADRDSFTIEARVKLRPSQNYQRAALIIYAGDGNQVSVMRRYHSAYGGSVFMTTMNTNGSAGSEDKYTGDIYSDECRLRLKKDKDKFYGYFSVDDGETWQELETRTQSIIDKSAEIKAGFYASNGDEDGVSVPVTFEEFTVNGKPISFWDM